MKREISKRGVLPCPFIRRSRAEQNSINRRVAIAIVFVMTMASCQPGAHESITSEQAGKSAPSKEETTPKPPPTDITDAANFARIEPGEFMMGSENGDDHEKPVHRVKISRAFEMGKYEVTQEQWQAVMGNNPSSFKGANLPVEQVSWEDAQEFIARLNARGDSYTYRLPTEAEWEYGCRAGSTGDYAGDLNAMAWYDDNSGGKTHTVGTKQPNAWGLYDMHGNVLEWCQDWHGENYYSQSPSVDPQGPSAGSDRVIRCGGWNLFAQACRSAMRYRGTPDGRGGHLSLGFRLVRTPR